jgi:CRISPR/Cas system-associated endonuclease/helicase Cas3
MWLLYIINAHIILDEFHEYDSTMLGNLRRFLEWFPGIRVLAMSATVSDALEKTVCGIRPETVIVRDRAVDNPAEWPRYCFHVVDPQDADSYFDPGTLWIVNQVKVAQDWAEAYQDALLYHSRFRYLDRKVVHQRFVDGFDKKNRSNLPRGIATQVAQSSLDISGKVLISEFAPIADLIQRLGRVGRYMTSKGEPPVHVYFYLPESVLPYHPDASMKPEICFRGSLDWAKALEAESQKRPLSQNDLDAAFRKASTKVNVDLISTKLHQTYRGAVRKSQMSACSFLPHDVKVHDLETTKEHDLIQKYEIPLYLTKEEMRLFRAEGRWVRYHYVVPPTYEYDTKHIRIGLRKPSFF